MKNVTPGSRLGPYEIVSRIGAGGMGEVWRAVDTRLDRHVAIKVLPAEFAQDAQFQVRFEREAKAISRLNHANICTLHDVGHEDGVSYLVMELLEGESLADRLAKGPLAPADVLKYGAQIAEALSLAHRARIVHRDLKPGNIMLTKSGAKLLDFGLAKSAAPVVTSSADDATVSPSGVTFVAPHKPLTTEGTIVGTFQYMAPEQLEGLEADARTDIFAFGAVLYEMATGKRPFNGTSRTTLIAQIVGAEPVPVRTLQPLASPTLEHIIVKALAKDPDDRWQSAHDVAAELRWVTDSQSQPGAPFTAVPRRRKREAAWLALTLFLAAAVVAMSILYLRQKENAGRVLVADLAAPEGTQFNDVGDESGPPALSPDGLHIVYSVDDATQSRLWLRNLSTGETKPLPGTEMGRYPFWSSDSRNIAFFSNGTLKRTGIDGGAPIGLTATGAGRGGTWAGDTIVFAPVGLGEIFKIPAAGGKPLAITTLDHARYTSHRWPSFLPDGKHFLFLAGNHQDGTGSSNAIYLGSTDGGQPRLVMNTTGSAIYNDGYLLTVRNTTLYAQKMSLAGSLSGEPLFVAENVLNDIGTWRSGFSVSDRGDIAYGAGQAVQSTSVEWVDRAGKQLAVILDKERFWDVELSPDQKKLAMTFGDPSRQLWLFDLVRKTRTRLDIQAKWVALPNWTPDGTTIVVNAIREQGFSFVAKPIDGSAPRQLVAFSDATPSFLGSGASISPDGKTWVYTMEKSLWRGPFDHSGQPVRLTQPALSAHAPRYSPDGKWLAYVSTESGRGDVFVSLADDLSRKWQVSDSGGTQPRWRADGQEMYYIDGQGRITAVAVHNTGDTIESMIRHFPTHRALTESVSSSSVSRARLPWVCA